MSLKMIGVILVVVSCGGFGFKVAASYLRELSTLRQIICALDYMECELQYRLTPLPELCRQTAAQSRGVVRELFLNLTVELEDQLSPDVERCVRAAMIKTRELPDVSKQMITFLGQNLGRFDIEGQLKGLESVRHESRRMLDRLSQDQIVRTRSYRTLGICAGAAIAIILI